jgi:hypothetical protein
MRVQRGSHVVTVKGVLDLPRIAAHLVHVVADRPDQRAQRLLLALRHNYLACRTNLLLLLPDRFRLKPGSHTA